MKKKKKNSKQFNRKFKKRFFTKKSVTVLLAAIIIMIIVGFGCNQQRKKAEIYQNTIDELSTEIRDIKETNKSLESEKDNINTDEFKEKMARERLGMIGKDEYSLEKSEGKEVEPAPEEKTSEKQSETKKSENN